MIEHDFTRGPWWPAETYDAAWSVEFLEHVGRQYMENYLSIFHKCALIFVTASGWGGWHHVEIHGPVRGIFNIHVLFVIVIHENYQHVKYDVHAYYSRLINLLVSTSIELISILLFPYFIHLIPTHLFIVVVEVSFCR